MGLVSEYLQNLIARQVDEKRLVLWFDPEGHYADLARDLALPDTTIARYDDSFFALRHAIEPLLGDDQPPRLVVYVPLAEEATDGALIELAATASILKPGQASPARNTRLAVVARRALRDTLGPERADELARQVEAGQLGLADLDRLNEQQGGSAVLVTLFGTSGPQEVVLRFLAEPGLDAQIVARGAVADLADALGRAFGIALTPDADPPALRAALARHLLTTECLARLVPLPDALATVAVATDPDARQACITAAQTWRLRRDLAESYAAHANQAEAALGLTGLGLSLDQLRDCQTFAATEAALQDAVAEALLEDANVEMLALLRERQSSFWATHDQRIQARWALAHAAGLTLHEARRIEGALKSAPSDPAALLRAYAEGEQPWCLLDTHQRTLERRWHLFDLGAHESLDRLVTRARQRYMDVGGALAEHFVRALAAAKFAVPGIPRQRDTFAGTVAPAIKAGKTAYILVDALRYEMARELWQSFEADSRGDLAVAMGTIPTITPIGMAALMPGAEGGARLVEASGGLVLAIGDAVLKDRASRIEWFKVRVGRTVAIAKLDDLLPKPRPALHAELQAAEVILITSQEIDQIAESDNIRTARKAMDDVLPDLARLANKLREYGCRTIVMTADHGYLFAEELESDMKIDPPGGQTVDLHRRAWIGRGGSADPAYLRAPLAQLGHDCDLEIAVPWGFGVFKAGGARAYFHGGMAPQEVAIPVLTLRPITLPRLSSPAAITWTLTTGSKKISSAFCSVNVGGKATGLFPLEAPRVRVEARARNEVLSRPVGATYGLVEATGEIELRPAADDGRAIEPNTITLMVTPGGHKAVAIYLLDAATGRELARVERVEVATLAF